MANLVLCTLGALDLSWLNLRKAVEATVQGTGRFVSDTREAVSSAAPVDVEEDSKRK